MKAAGDYSFYIIRRNDNVSAVEEFGIENPVLNSYELLWRELSNAENNSILTTQNIMRQILNHYFKVVGKSVNEGLLQKFENTREQEICRSLLSRINSEVHRMPDDLYIEPQNTAAETYFEVFRKIFTLMGHQEHYEMMFREQEALVS